MRATMTAAAQAAQASEAPAATGGAAAPGAGGGQAAGGGGGTPQAAILQSRALVTPPVTVVGQVSFLFFDKYNMDLWRKELLKEQNKELIFIHHWK